MKIDKDYIIRIRRELHQVPEIGFDLPKTLAIIRRELDAIGLPYTERFGTSSIVATLNEGKRKTIALRADTDALPVQEQTGLPFASTIPGQMHACGHDCHTAMLLGAAKALKEMEAEIGCCVKFVFQACEEGTGGAKRICDDGFMDDVDQIIACHIMPNHSAGMLLIGQSCINASSHSFRIHLQGKAAHVARPHQGVDAIAMGVRVYNDIQIMRAREMDPFEPVVIGIGEFHGGSANNVICDEVMLHGTVRALSDEVDAKIFRRMEEIVQSVSQDMGGSGWVESYNYTPCVINHPDVRDSLRKAAQQVVGNSQVKERPGSMGAEDFAFYLQHKPGAMFHLGVAPDMENTIPLHSGKLIIDEDALDTGAKVFVQFVLNEM